MKRAYKFLVASTLMLAAAPAYAQQAPAPDAPKKEEPSDKNMAEAKQRYKAGLGLYDDGAYDAARVQLERAYQLAPSYKILYNIGLVYKQLNEFVGSLRTFEQYLREGGSEVPEDRKAEVTKAIETLKNIIAYADVTVNVPGADITVDDAVVGKSPMSESIPLNPGRRKIGAKREGRLPEAKVITVASGDKVAVALNLVEPTTTVVNVGTDVTPIIAWTVTGAFAVSAGITGYLAAKANDDLSNAKKQAPPPAGTPSTLAKELSDDHSKMKTFALATDLLVAGTIVSAGVATYFTWFRKHKTKEESNKPTADFTLTPGGAAVFGTF